MRLGFLASLAVLMSMTAPSAADDLVLLHAAGSLRGALSDVAASFEAATGTKVKTKFGASGLLKDEIAGGAKAEVFASANMEHPRALALAKRSGPVVLFARNRLCALVKPGLIVGPETLLDRMLDAGIKLGTSTPRADPSGDYAWEVFRMADKIKPGAYALLDKKALQLTGGPTSPPAPPDRSIYGMLLAQGAADIFLTYCTGALAAQKENPGQQIVGLPDTLAVGADYGLTAINDASASAYKFALFILSTEGQQLLAKHGFTAPGAAP
jgi:molybdate transport system substrate-binding protein